MPSESLVAFANTAFCADLTPRLPAGNLFFSPFSIEAALAMTTAGADGDTLKEMKATLRLEFPEKDIDDGFAALFSLISPTTNPAERGYALSVANAIYASKEYVWKEAFIDRVRNLYRSEIKSCDFLNNSEGVRKEINAWVEEKTNNKIKNLIANGMLSPSSSMVLVNAIYFKGDWQTQFEKTSTVEKPFFLADGEKSNAMLMQRSGEITLYEEELFNAVYLPYANNEVGMVVILPNAPTEGIPNLPHVEKSLTAEKLTTLTGSLSSGWGDGIARHDTIVNLALPRFRVETEYGLRDPLDSMGMKLAFSDLADFRKMTDKLTQISAILHKAFVEVNEEGTEAAAATAVVMRATCESMPRVPRRRVNFIADHPFLFAIVHRSTNTILFWGRVEKP